MQPQVVGAAVITNDFLLVADAGRRGNSPFFLTAISLHLEFVRLRKSSRFERVKWSSVCR
jgi:hypothetical protein